ncbi:hypothetical protein, partial [Imperialibacter sp. 89]
MKNVLVYFTILSGIFTTAQGQSVINAYAKVTNVSGANLSLSNVNETYATFEAGEKVLIMQMQDNVIGSNTGNNANFGNISTIGSAGLYEEATIQSVTESAGTPTSVILTSSLTNSYVVGTNSSIQIISFPEYVNYTTSANLTALPWNGNVGGVFAIDVNNTLTLANNISVNAQGFTGGLPNPTGDGTGCDAATYITNSNSYARKGESIYKVTSTNYRAARGKVANGGGGG